jgi:hypothetical protein
MRTEILYLSAMVEALHELQPSSRVQRHAEKQPALLELTASPY